MTDTDYRALCHDKWRLIPGFVTRANDPLIWESYWKTRIAKTHNSQPRKGEVLAIAKKLLEKRSETPRQDYVALVHKLSMKGKGLTGRPKTAPPPPDGSTLYYAVVHTMGGSQILGPFITHKAAMSRRSFTVRKLLALGADTLNKCELEWLEQSLRR